MKTKLNVEIDVRDFRKAAVLLDIDIPTDEEIQQWCESEQDMPEDMMAGESAQMKIWLAMVVIYNNVKDELDKPEEKPKSKFQQRLEEAQKLQDAKKNN